MALDPRTPVLVGVGQVAQKAKTVEEARTVVPLIADAVRAAAADAGLARVPDVDSIRVVALLSWRYRDPARFVAAELGITTRETVYTAQGGNTPQSLVNLTALEIQSGALDIAVLCGGETWRTRARARKEGKDLGLAKVGEEVRPDRVIGEELEMSLEAERERGIVQPVQVYPMFETALRAAAHEGVEEHQRKISELWARFAAVAKENPYAYVRSGPSAEEIRTPGPKNRMIGFPYPKMMNSNNDVDQSAALILCSAAKARELGIAEDRWVFPHAGTDCHEHYAVSHRWSFAETPAVVAGGARVLELAGIGIDDVEIVDLYSCFPSAVQLGAQSLGLGLDRQLTRTGGLPFGGGPWNNYVMHAIATVANDLRARPGARGLVWANGGFVTKHAFGVYSTTPPTEGFRHDASFQAALDADPRRALAAPAEAEGPATVEAYTVMHDRDGQPEQAFAACLLSDGRRAWGTSNDPVLGAALCADEWVGRPVELTADGTLLA
jgi:acetyl-CoA C-acetyltransferase